EDEHPLRSVFARDRDRVIHTTAFRRLQYKTQVFICYEGDHYRNRLTHTIEVAQVARTIARILSVNEDLTEAIALAHDLGHSPFGHAGERTLSLLLADHGGFEHNFQSLRIVSRIESPYSGYQGLNLTKDTLEALDKKNEGLLRKINIKIDNFKQSSLEGQIVDIADFIAYTSHDLDDAISSGLITFEMLSDIRIFDDLIKSSASSSNSMDSKRKRIFITKGLINKIVQDVVTTTSERLSKANYKSSNDVRNSGSKSVTLSDRMGVDAKILRKLLFDNFYMSEKVKMMEYKVDQIICKLFEAYSNETSLMPSDVCSHIVESGANMPRIVCDYIAGMTDRFAQKEYEKLL
ncbi:MAG: deoxyguanosinetriphosphate triphosphohydrolase, partial [Nitrospinota bacterium]